MFDMVKRFPAQLEEAMKIGSNAKLTPLILCQNLFLSPVWAVQE